MISQRWYKSSTVKRVQETKSNKRLNLNAVALILRLILLKNMEPLSKDKQMNHNTTFSQATKAMSCMRRNISQKLSYKMSCLHSPEKARLYRQSPEEARSPKTKTSSKPQEPTKKYKLSLNKFCLLTTR